MLVDLVNGQYIEPARYDQVTSNVNVMRFLNSMNIKMWSPHRETEHSLRCD